MVPTSRAIATFVALARVKGVTPGASTDDANAPPAAAAANTAPLRLALDARDLLVAERTGVERVVFEFVRNLALLDRRI